MLVHLRPADLAPAIWGVRVRLGVNKEENSSTNAAIWNTIRQLRLNSNVGFLLFPVCHLPAQQICPLRVGRSKLAAEDMKWTWTVDADGRDWTDPEQGTHPNSKAVCLLEQGTPPTPQRLHFA